MEVEKRMNDTATIILIILLLTFSIKILIDNGKLEREAIRRGYATYNKQGEFVWKEKNSMDILEEKWKEVKEHK